ncbi:hypothetical protein [Nostoc sp.]|uniref:hypothetical protein n=1 Tax=Nostoc sp. TaxID=1180 RepID=UPI002FFCABAB
MSSRLILGLIIELNLNGHPEEILLISEQKEKSLTGSLKFTQPISFNQLIRDLAKQLSCEIGKMIPESLNELGLIIKQLTISYEENKGYSFICSAEWKIEENKSLDINITLKTEIENQKKSLNAAFELQLSGHKFDLKFQKSQKQNDSIFLIANYQDRGEIKLRNLVDCLSSTLAEEIPESFAFKVNQIFFIYVKNSQLKSSQFIFGLDLGLKFSLKDIPLIGSEIPQEQDFGLENLHFLFASHEFSDITSFASVIEKNNSHLIPTTSTKLEKGLYLGAVLNFFGEKENIYFELSSPKKVEESKSTSSNAKKANAAAQKSSKKDNKPSISASNGTLWLNLNKSWKFLELKRIGIR